MIQEEKYRAVIADTMTDEEIDVLVDTALEARIAGIDEPGLGNNMLDLLNHSSITEFREKQKTDSKDKEKTGSKPKASPIDSSRSGSGNALGRVVDIGDDSKPLSTEVALYYSGGNHYEMIYKKDKNVLQ